MPSEKSVLDQIENDPSTDEIPMDSSSDDSDLMAPTHDEDASDSDYELPFETSSDGSDEDYEPPSQKKASIRRSAAWWRFEQKSPSPKPGPSGESLQGAKPSIPQTTKTRIEQKSPSPKPGPFGESLQGTKPSTPQTTKTRRERKTPSPQPSPFGESLQGAEPSTPQTTQTSGASDSDDRWRNGNEEDTAPESLCFRPTNPPGPILDTTSSWTALQLFQLFFSSSVVKTIIDNTNLNAQRRKLAGVKYAWEPLDIKDFYIFLAILVYTGLCGVPEQPDYWRKSFPYGNPFPGNTMPRARFEAILWSLHLSDPSKDEENDRKRGTPEYDRLFKLKPLYTDIQTACMDNFQPDKNISIDERMVASKAKIGMKQYNKDKPTKWGYKLFVLADSTTGYTWNFSIYSGKSDSRSKHGLGYSSVMDLLPFDQLGSGYTLYVDNFYTSPALFLELKEKNMGACGTIRKHLPGFPTTTVNDLPKKARRGDVRWLRKDSLLFVKWMDKREVAMCSSVHKASSGQTVPRNIKTQGVWSIENVPVPDAVLDYNKNMGGVLSDALIGFYTVHHKTMKWYKTLFYHFLDIVIVNSHILYRETEKTLATGTKILTQKKFREALCEQLVEYAKSSVPAVPVTPSVTCMPTYYPGSTRKYCRRCFDAGEKRVKTAVHCRKCQVPLCLTSQKNCFTIWHDENHQM
ncbi:piggyBac transposable element-derived protein 4-like [Boleophthalmus pectinirostris]|uniref:piggyBac transposable element-derived protein 4-like n=1 Tax=Boleophthalmus pectinirostris TaxID=150288 RepID=UPI00242B9A0B|nr:piggyBac transposable element-derived protein 4-like [Boleophthalmus pectinirostris]